MKFVSTQILLKSELRNPTYMDYANNRQFADIGRGLFAALAHETGCVVLKISKQQCTSPSNPTNMDRVYTVDYQHITEDEYRETLTRHSSHEAINGYYPDRKV